MLRQGEKWVRRSFAGRYFELTDDQTVVEKPSGFTPYRSFELPGSITTADLFDFTKGL
jgi:hypothetical protein